MSLVVRDPFRDMVALRDVMERLVEETFVRPPGWPVFDRGVNNITLDMYEEGNNLIINAAVPGIKPDDLRVQVLDNVLTIKAESKEEMERKERNYYLREHRFDRFERSVTLPCRVISDRSEAVFRNGIVTLTLPKAEESRMKQIPITTAK